MLSQKLNPCKNPNHVFMSLILVGGVTFGVGGLISFVHRHGIHATAPAETKTQCKFSRYSSKGYDSIFK